MTAMHTAEWGPHVGSLSARKLLRRLRIKMALKARMEAVTPCSEGGLVPVESPTSKCGSTGSVGLTIMA